MENKRKWYSILLVGLVLILATSAIGCGQVYLKADLEAARQTARETGYTEGYASGKTEGYTEGHDKGYEAGKVDGYAIGYKAGYETGKADGYDAGHLKGNKVGYDKCYDAGIIELEAAKQEAEKLGYDNGYEAGIAAAQQESQETAEAEREAAMARLEDLSYIGALVDNYSDDADPDPEGIWLMIFFYDSKSKLITFKDIPLIATIKLYDLELYPPSHPSREFMYQDTVTIDHTVGLGAEIRIPFKDLKNYFHTSSDHAVEAQVTVTTPNQGDFSVTETGWPVKLLW